MPLSPTKLTLRHLRDVEGWPLVEVVERWNAHARIRQDLFGFIDVLAVGAPPALTREFADLGIYALGETLAVQTTTAGEVSRRIHKIEDHPNLGHVREAGWRIVVHGWAKKNGRWVLAREVDVS